MCPPNVLITEAANNINEQLTSDFSLILSHGHDFIDE